ncbi:MAG: VOC family protein [Sphingomonas sp.]|nr:VOC family protein [Sphingomonas sp.]
MSIGTLEHVNVTVADPKRTAQMLCDLFGWHIRWQGPAKANGFTVHVGANDNYLAVYAYPPGGAPALDGGRLNHIGVVVDDLDAAEAKVVAAGCTPFNHRDYGPCRSFYFEDENGIEFEVVSYA